MEWLRAHVSRSPATAWFTSQAINAFQAVSFCRGKRPTWPGRWHSLRRTPARPARVPSAARHRHPTSAWSASSANAAACGSAATPGVMTACIMHGLQRCAAAAASSSSAATRATAPGSLLVQSDSQCRPPHTCSSSMAGQSDAASRQRNCRLTHGRRLITQQAQQLVFVFVTHFLRYGRMPAHVRRLPVL